MQFITDVGDEYSFIGYYDRILSDDIHKNITNWTNNRTDIRYGESSYGTEIPRGQIWFHEHGSYFSDEWKPPRIPRWESSEYTPELYSFQSIIQDKVNNIIKDYDKLESHPFNSCLMNVYEHEKHSIKLHSDSQRAFGKRPLIAIYSIGETRDIYFYRKLYNSDDIGSTKLDKVNKKTIKLSLKANSLLIMGGTTQEYYCHEIPKCTEKKNKRISLTFRNHSI